MIIRLSNNINRRLPKSYLSCIIPMIFLILFSLAFIVFPEFLMKNLTLILILYVLFGAIFILGPPLIKSLRFKYEKNSHICPYCKKKNPIDRKTCQFCEYPLGESLENKNS